MNSDAWIPAELPESWQVIPIKDVCQVVRGGSPRPMGDPRFFNGNIPFIKISDVTKSDGLRVFDSDTKVNEAGVKKSRFLRKGKLILSNSGTVCVPVFLGVDACIHDGFVAFEGLPDSIDRKYLYHYFKYIRPFVIERNKQGVTQVNLNTQIVGEISLLLPPFTEQHRIVAKIETLFSELDKGIESLKTAREQLKVYRQAVLKHAFEGKITAQWREENKDKLESPEQLLARIQKERQARYQQQLKDWEAAVKAWIRNGKEGKKPGRPKKLAEIKRVVAEDCRNFPFLPKGWSYVRLGTLIDEPTYGTSAKCAYESGDQGVLRIPNIINGFVDETDLKFATFEKGEVDHLSLEEGDILIIRSNGSISLVGSCALVAAKDTRHIFAGYLIRLRPNSNLVLPSFLLSVMVSHFLRKQIEFAAKSTSGVNNINTSELQKLIVPLPSIEEQRELLNHLDFLKPSVKAAEEELVNQLEKTEALRQSILKKAFSGQLASQGSSDEPVKHLLKKTRWDV